MTPDEHAAAPGYEQRDASPRPLALIGAALGIVLVAASVAMHLLLHRLNEREAARSGPASPLAAAVGRAEPPAPRLQVNPRRDLATLRAREQALLDGYAWVDRDAGKVRIPVARAMELLEDGR
jgi:hypothetical protein